MPVFSKRQIEKWREEGRIVAGLVATYCDAGPPFERAWDPHPGRETLFPSSDQMGLT